MSQASEASEAPTPSTERLMAAAQELAAALDGVVLGVHLVLAFSVPGLGSPVRGVAA